MEDFETLSLRQNGCHFADNTSNRIFLNENTVETLYNTINFCWSTHKRHSIARPKGRGMGCLLWDLCRLINIELYKMFAIINRAIKGLYCIRLSIKISLKLIPKGPINNIPALVQIMAWHRPGDKPLSEPVMVRLPRYICVTRPQWVKKIAHHSITLSISIFRLRHCPCPILWGWDDSHSFVTWTLSYQ